MTITHVNGALYPITLVTAVFGLSPIYLSSQTKKQTIFDVLKVVTFLYLSLFTSLLYAVFANPDPIQFQKNYESGVPFLGLLFQLIAQTVVVYVVYLTNNANHHKLLSFIREIESIDAIFEDLGEKIRYNKHRNYELFTIGTGLSVLLGRTVLNYFYAKSHVVFFSDDLYALFVFPCFVLFLLQTQFTLMVTLLYERFNLINRQLRNVARRHEKKTTLTKIIPFPGELGIKNRDYCLAEILKKIEYFMELHDRLGDAGNQLNASFTIQILVAFTSQFIAIVFTIFYVYYESLVAKNVMVAANWATWTLVTILQILHITITCHVTCGEAHTTGLEIHELLLNEQDPQLRKRLMIFSQQVTHQSLQFTACGLFPIDATLLFTITGAAATYLLIMLQFQEGTENQCPDGTIVQGSTSQ